MGSGRAPGAGLTAAATGTASGTPSPSGRCTGAADDGGRPDVSGAAAGRDRRGKTASATNRQAQNGAKYLRSAESVDQ